ncbi:MAG: hypothetical protein LQ346_004768 [Caloplaca aetnensis]|nr:MAG: hypothetical protein LQ346_004768 [Caloplaca aetnensis]
MRSSDYPPAVYDQLIHSVTHVLHNAWQVHFNLPLDCFREHILGVRHLTNFAANSTRNTHIFFISSVASVLNGVSDTIEERIFNDFEMAQPMGYGESKHIAERLLYTAGLESNISSSICRRLKDTVSCVKDIERNQAVKILDFFSARVQSNASPIMETKLSVQYSQMLRRLQRIDADQMRL